MLEPSLPSEMARKPHPRKDEKIRRLMSLSEVNDHLFIGPAKVIDETTFRHQHIMCVINIGAKALLFEDSGIKYIHLPLDDSVQENIYDYLDEIADEINSTRERGGKSIVCCVAGISRSASFCIAYLMKYEQMTLRAAFLYLKNKRKFVRPNIGFIEQLIRYEKTLFGETSVKMIPVTVADADDCVIPDVYHEACKGLVWLKSCKDFLKAEK